MLFAALCLLFVAGVNAEGGLPYCADCGEDCRPPRDVSVSALNWETHSEADPDHPETTRSCACLCGKREFEGCVRGECGYGLRCLHSKHSAVNGGNVCKPLCSDPGVYQSKLYTSCEEDITNDVAHVIPRVVQCSEYELATRAMRSLSDGHHVEFTFINPCEMNNANAELLVQMDGGSSWIISGL